MPTTYVPHLLLECRTPTDNLQCIVDRIQKHRIYIVGSTSPRSPQAPPLDLMANNRTTANDRDLKRRIRKVPGVPIMSVAKGKYLIERLPGAPAT